MSGFRHAVQCERPGGAFDVHGRWIEGAEARPFTIQASVQPLSAREMNAMTAEGRTLDGLLRLYTDFKLRTVDEVGVKNPDRVKLDDGSLCEVIKVFRWRNGVIPHYKAIISILAQAPDGVS